MVSWVPLVSFWLAASDYILRITPIAERGNGSSAVDAEPAEEGAIDMLDWNRLKEECANCTRCGLCETRHNVVFGVGNKKSAIMFVGEGPGEQEDLQGIPFVGPAGKLLDDMLSIIDLSREENCYIANIVKCRPPRNRDPLETEQDVCVKL